MSHTGSSEGGTGPDRPRGRHMPVQHVGRGQGRIPAFLKMQRGALFGVFFVVVVLLAQAAMLAQPRGFAREQGMAAGEALINGDATRVQSDPRYGPAAPIQRPVGSAAERVAPFGVDVTGWPVGIESARALLDRHELMAAEQAPDWLAVIWKLAPFLLLLALLLAPRRQGRLARSIRKHIASYIRARRRRADSNVRVHH